MKIEKILLPTDFSDCARSALTSAIFLANQYGAELHLMHVIVLHDDDPFHPAYHFPDSEEIYEHLRKIAGSEMKNLMADEQGQTLRIREHQVRAFAAAPAIVELAASEGIDLIVMGAHGHRGLRRFFLGSVTEEVIRTADCPVLTLRQDGRDPLEALGKIVAPVDFSNASNWALGVARELASVYRARLDVVHVVEQTTPSYPYEPFPSTASQEETPMLLVKIEDALARMVADLGEPTAAAGEGESRELEVMPKVLRGDPARAVAAYVKDEDAGLVVIASQGLGALEHFLLGSVSEKVSRLVECPVLILKGEPKATRVESTPASVPAEEAKQAV